MTLGRASGFAIAVVMVLVGALWFAQGNGWVGGSSMSGESFWAYAGAITSGLGLALGYVLVGNLRRDAQRTDLEKERYGGKKG